MEAGPPMSTWLAIIGVSLATFLLRASFVVFADPHRFPHRFRQALTFVSPAVLAAIVVPGLLFSHGAIDLTAGNPRWIAGAIAILVAARSRNALAAIATGMCALWFLQWAIG
jgi:branched-subunit amino acid transport protein